MVLRAEMDQQRSRERSESISQSNQDGKWCADCLQFAPDKTGAFPVTDHTLWLPGAGTGKVRAWKHKKDSEQQKVPL